MIVPIISAIFFKPISTLYDYWNHRIVKVGCSGWKLMTEVSQIYMDFCILTFTSSKILNFKGHQVCQYIGWCKWVRQACRFWIGEGTFLQQNKLSRVSILSQQIPMLTTTCNYMVLFFLCRQPSWMMLNQVKALLTGWPQRFVSLHVQLIPLIGWTGSRWIICLSYSV